MKLNLQLNHKDIWSKSLVGMTLGFLSTLVVGTIIGLFGINQNNQWSHLINSIKGIFTYATPFGIGAGIAIKAKLKPLQILAVILGTGIAAHTLFVPTWKDGIIWKPELGFRGMSIKNNHLFALPGDVFGAWISATLFVYIFSIFQWNMILDVIIIPMIGAMIGLIFAMSLTYLTSSLTIMLEWVIDNSINKYHWVAILLAPVIGIIMGLALTLPTSSAAIAFAVNLHGDAATAAMAATAAQMISFGVLTYISTKSINTSLAVAFGSSMLQMPNFVKKPKMLIIPVIASAVAAIIATAATPLQFSQRGVTSGMGACALYGQIFTLQENGWANGTAWINVIIIQLVLPVLITIPLSIYALKNKWFKKSDLEIKND